MPRTGKHGAAAWRPMVHGPERKQWSPIEPPASRSRSDRVRWAELCRNPELVGHWVALDAVRYEDGLPFDGELVDVDEDLAALCARVQSADETSCAILYCDPSGSGTRRMGLS